MIWSGTQGKDGLSATLNFRAQAGQPKATPVIETPTLRPNSVCDTALLCSGLPGRDNCPS
jgi:hypothetical protein